MRKIFPGTGKITPYRPWSGERKAAARAEIASRGKNLLVTTPERISALKAEVALREDIEEIAKSLVARGRHESAAIVRRAGQQTLDEMWAKRTRGNT